MKIKFFVWGLALLAPTIACGITSQQLVNRCNTVKDVGMVCVYRPHYDGTHSAALFIVKDKLTLNKAWAEIWSKLVVYYCADPHGMLIFMTIHPLHGIIYHCRAHKNV